MWLTAAAAFRACPMPAPCCPCACHAGLGSKTRRRTLRRWVKHGRQLPTELAAEVDAAAVGPADGAAGDEEASSEDGAAEVDMPGTGVDEQQAAWEGMAARAMPADQAPAHGCAGSSSSGAGAASTEHKAGAALGLADLRNAGHAWHGQQVGFSGAWQRVSCFDGSLACHFRFASFSWFLGDTESLAAPYAGCDCCFASLQLIASSCLAPASPLAGQVVERLMAEGGEQALLGLCQRFRQAFVEALQPQVDGFAQSACCTACNQGRCLGCKQQPAKCRSWCMHMSAGLLAGHLATRVLHYQASKCHGPELLIRAVLICSWSSCSSCPLDGRCSTLESASLASTPYTGLVEGGTDAMAEVAGLRCMSDIVCGANRKCK